MSSLEITPGARSSQPAALRTAGYRVTAPCRAILRALETSERPLTVEEILARMDGHPPAVPTVYRNLRKFTHLGWIESMMGPDQAMRFVRCLSSEHHCHVQCEQCGRVVEAEGCFIPEVLKAMATRSGFRITHHRLQLFGVCPSCQLSGDQKR